MRHAVWSGLLFACSTTAAPTPTAKQPPATIDDDVPARTWRPLENQPSFTNGAGTPLLMTDGTIFVQDTGSNDFWKLVPDAFGGYEHGTWVQLANGPDVDDDNDPGTPMVGYAPLYYASAVMTDGRIIVMGGEYQNFNPEWTKAGAIYDPQTDSWQVMKAPDGWQTIGDASSIVLADTTFMLSTCCDPNMKSALLDASALTWRATGEGKADVHDEEAWAMLQDGRVLTTDAENTDDPHYSEIYDPATTHWTGAGDVPVFLADNPAAGGNSYEVGPEVTRVDGTVVAFGGTTHNALYDPKTSTWSRLPDFPDVGSPLPQRMADAPAVLLPNGDILLATSPIFTCTTPGCAGPVHMFELHDSTFTEVMAPPPSASDTSYEHIFLVLPTGEILHTGQNNDIELYTPEPGFPAAAQPVILGAPELVTPNPIAQTAPIATVYRERVYQLTVQRMNGVSQGAYYGDDVQTSTNYPIVRVTNIDTGHVSYCRTHDHSDRSIAPDERGQTLFDVPAAIEPGISELSVIANGIPSPAIEVNVK